MNLQQPTNVQPAVAEAEDVAASQRISTTFEGSARRDVAAAGMAFKAQGAKKRRLLLRDALAVGFPVQSRLSMANSA